MKSSCVQLLQRQAAARRRPRRAPRRAARASACRVALQQVDHPGQRVGGGVLAGQQHGQHVAGHLLVVDAAVGLVGGHDHRFEQVAAACRGSAGSAASRCARLRR